MKSAGNAVISTYPTHWSHGLQGSLKRRRKHPTFVFADESGVHTRLSEKDRTQGHTRRNTGRFGWGGITTLGAFRTFTNIPGPGIRTANFAAFGSWSGVLPKNAKSLRDSDAHDARRCPAGVAAPLGCVIFSVSVEIYGFTPRTQGFLCVRGGGGITTPGARCVLPKVSAPACQSGLFAVF